MAAGSAQSHSTAPMPSMMLCQRCFKVALLSLETACWPLFCYEIRRPTSAPEAVQLHHPGPGRPEGLASVAWYGVGPAHYAAPGRMTWCPASEVFIPVPAGLSVTRRKRMRST